MTEIRVKPSEWKKRIDTFIRKGISEAFVYFEVRKSVPKIEEFRDKALSIIERDKGHLKDEAEEIEQNLKGKGKEYFVWANDVINHLKDNNDFLKEVSEWREKLIWKTKKQ